MAYKNDVIMAKKNDKSIQFLAPIFYAMCGVKKLA